MMRNVSDSFHDLRQRVSPLLQLRADTWRFLVLSLRPSPALAAEVLFLRKQLALYEERQIKPKRATHTMRLAMVWLSCWFDWGSALCIVKPETFTRWHRQGFRLFWRWKSNPGRPALPKDVQALIRRVMFQKWTFDRKHAMIWPTSQGEYHSSYSRAVPSLSA